MAITITTNARKYTMVKANGSIAAAIHPKKNGTMTVYVSKHITTEPKKVKELLAGYKCEAVVNPTYKTTGGKDTFSVKATVVEADPKKVKAIGEILAKQFPAKAKTEKAPAKAKSAPAKKKEPKKFVQVKHEEPTPA